MGTKLLQLKFFKLNDNLLKSLLILFLSTFTLNYSLELDFKDLDFESQHRISERAAIYNPQNPQKNIPGSLKTDLKYLDSSEIRPQSRSRVSFPYAAEPIQFLTASAAPSLRTQGQRSAISLRKDRNFKFPAQIQQQQQNEQVELENDKTSRESRSNQNGNLTSESSAEAGTSRKASPDVQDIIDGIVKLLGGKVPGSGESSAAVPTSLTAQNQQSPSRIGSISTQNQQQNQQISPIYAQQPPPKQQQQPYNLFNPGKPIFPGGPNAFFPGGTAKPTRINNRGPPLFNPNLQQQQQNGPISSAQQQQQQSSSFEAIPLEALHSDFNLNQAKFGPPFPLPTTGTSGQGQPIYGGIGGQLPQQHQQQQIHQQQQQQQNQAYHQQQYLNQQRPHQIPQNPKHPAPYEVGVQLPERIVPLEAQNFGQQSQEQQKFQQNSQEQQQNQQKYQQNSQERPQNQQNQQNFQQNSQERPQNQQNQQNFQQNSQERPQNQQNFQQNSQERPQKQPEKRPSLSQMIHQIKQSQEKHIEEPKPSEVDPVDVVDDEVGEIYSNEQIENENENENSKPQIEITASSQILKSTEEPEIPIKLGPTEQIILPSSRSTTSAPSLTTTEPVYIVNVNTITNVETHTQSSTSRLGGGQVKFPEKTLENSVISTTKTTNFFPSTITSSSGISPSRTVVPAIMYSTMTHQGQGHQGQDQGHPGFQQRPIMSTYPSTSTNSPRPGQHLQQTPPLRPGVVFHEGPAKPPRGYGSVEVVTADNIKSSSSGDGPGQYGEIFDITVSAKQNFGGKVQVQQTRIPHLGHGQGQQGQGQPYVIPVDLKDEIITHPTGHEQFVSIDGQRTYFKMHGQPTSTQSLGTGSVTRTPGPVPAPVNVIGSVSGAPVQDLTTITKQKPLGSSANNKNPYGSIMGPAISVQASLTPGSSLGVQSPKPGGSNAANRAVSTTLTINGGGSNGQTLSSGQNGLVTANKTPNSNSNNNGNNNTPNIIRRPPFGRRPTAPPVRIDTCIVGDSSTCSSEQYEICKTESGVSSCVCRSGYARRRHREPCKAIVSLVLSMRLDRLGEKKLVYDPEYFNQNSEIYQAIEWELIHALDSALSETTLQQGYVGSKMEAIGYDGRQAVVNATILVQENPKFPAPQVKRELQKQLIQVLTRHRNNFGNSKLWVDGPISAINAITDSDECSDNSEANDCDPSRAKCINTFGSFECRCEAGYGDQFEGDKRRSGRKCESCSGKHYCNGRGECRIDNGQKVCVCSGNFYGSACDIDGEVMAVAIGASVSALVIIGLTLGCLCMWSRRWKREEQKAAIISRTLFGGVASQALSYISKNTMNSSNPYQQHVSIDDRMRWAQQVVDTNLNGNLYVQSDPMSYHQASPQLMMETPPPRSSQHRPIDVGGNCDDDIYDEQRQIPKRPRSRASQLQMQGPNSIYYDLEPDVNQQQEIYASRHGLGLAPFPAQFCVTPINPYIQSRGYYN